MTRLLVILGPTATGKTELALKLAERHQGEIISADSVMVYRGLDIGSAKPAEAERARIPHHCLDIADPHEPYTVADFQRDAKNAIDDVAKRGKLPILAGGTGLYIRAVIRGYAFIESGGDEYLRQRLRREAEIYGSAHLHHKLSVLDPQTAARLHPNDLRRVIRALEVLELSQVPISRQVSATPPDLTYDALIFGLNMPRPLLYRRIEERVERMMASGLVAEVAGLLARGVSPAAKAMQSLGYKQIAAFLNGESTLDEAVEATKRDTRRFAKRQLTWFRRDSQINWLDLAGRPFPEEMTAKISSVIAGQWK